MEKTLAAALACVLLAPRAPPAESGGPRRPDYSFDRTISREVQVINSRFP